MAATRKLQGRARGRSVRPSSSWSNKSDGDLSDRAESCGGGCKCDTPHRLTNTFFH